MSTTGPHSSPPKRHTTKSLYLKKQGHERITMLTAYDYTFARIIDSAGIDILLVGDSLGNVILGYDSTLPVTLDEMIYHAKAVVKGSSQAMVVVDMPFLTYQVTVEKALSNAGEIMKKSGAQAVKIEGGANLAGVVKKLTDTGIPVMGHLGLIPQSIHKFGSYAVRAKEEEEAEILVNDAKVLEESGCFAIVLEKIPADLAKKVTDSLQIPTIGIGAGPHCDGQVLVSYDMLGLNKDFHPRFLRFYADMTESVFNAVQQYIHDVRQGDYPNEKESY